MKRTLPALAILITILLNGCEKDQSILLNEKTLIKSEKGLLCRGCGDWDLSDPSATPQAETFRIVTTDTISAVKKSEEKDSRKKNKSDRKEDDSKEKSSDRKDK